jgi:translation initiation factor IF-1
MKRRIGAGGCRGFVIATGADRHASDPLRLPAAIIALRRLVHDRGGAAQLRLLLFDVCGVPVHGLCNEEVVERIVLLLRQGRISVHAVLAPAAGTLAERMHLAEEMVSPDSALGPAKEKTWIELELIGENGLGIPSERFRIELPDGTVRDGRLDERGRARIEDINPGTCIVTFPALDEEAWVRA